MTDETNAPSPDETVTERPAPPEGTRYDDVISEEELYISLNEEELVERLVEIGRVDDALALFREISSQRRFAAFTERLAAAKAEIEVVRKDATAQSGDGKPYQYASMGSIYDAVVPALSKHGIAHWFNLAQVGAGGRPVEGETGARIAVTAVVSAAGWVKETTLHAVTQGKPGTSEAQKLGGTAKILERSTLLAALGLADEDDPAMMESAQAVPVAPNGEPADDSVVLKMIEDATTLAELEEVGELMRVNDGKVFPVITDAESFRRVRNAYAAKWRPMKSAAEREKEASNG